jgi:hypothetical protein
MLAPPTSPRPLALDDSQITTIMSFARPLSPDDRDVFLQRVANVLAGQPVLGDGIVARVCREIFKEHWKAPELDVRPGKHGR